MMKFCADARKLLFLVSLFSSLSFSEGADLERHSSTPQSARLEVGRLRDGTVRIRGRTDRHMVLQASENLSDWTDLKTDLPANSEFEVLDPESAERSRRYYRLKGVPEEASLPDLGELVNSVFVAGEGFTTVEFAPSGLLGFIVWRNEELLYRQKTPEGIWSDHTVCRTGMKYQPGAFDEHRFQPPAALLYDPNSRPHVLCLEAGGQSFSHHVREHNGEWRQAEVIAPGDSQGSFVLFAAAAGPGGALHLAVVTAGSSPALIYGSNRLGTWRWNRVASISGDARGFLRQSYSPRFFSLAVDSENTAHLTFTPSFQLGTGPEGYPRPSSELAYASNRAGDWRVERIAGPPDGSGDAGLGACVAVGPDGQPAIAAWYDERAETGSAQWSQLLFYRRESSGQWSSSVVARNPEGYSAGDGPKGTGFAPCLKFDPRGRPHIAFSDHAGEHFGQSGQNEYAGQIRHALLEGGQWSIRTIFRQEAPLQGQMIYPTLAVSATEIAFLGLERKTQWGSDSWPRTPPVSSYRFVFVTTPAP
jgi:hypothetical protein